MTVENQTIVIDTFPEFEDYWLEYRSRTVDAQINGWASIYLDKWPDLLRKQIGQYETEHSDWKLIARERIFPAIEKRLPAMRLARRRLRQEALGILDHAQKRFKTPFSPLVVIYVGIGLGAGWATTFRGSPALLFGLENIAEEGWTDRASIRGLVAHELGHLLHFYWRRKAGRKFREGALWDLYTEGFADRCEELLLNEDGSHVAKGAGKRGWENWCEKNKRWLAHEFLRRMARKLDMRPFFGSWLRLRGHSQTGYYLGSEIIQSMENSLSIQEIAELENISFHMEQSLRAMAS